MKGHRQCSTPGCSNIIAKKNKKKGAICGPCKSKLVVPQPRVEPAVAEQKPELPPPVSFADRLANLEKNVKG